MTTRQSVAAVLALVLTLGACADDRVDDAGRPPADALTWTGAPLDDLGGVAVTIGSREAGHHQVLGWATYEIAAALGADVGADVGLGGSTANREAQLAGLTDLYWETTGTAWLRLLREFGPSGDPDQLYDDVAEADAAENDIVWLAPAPANAGTALIMAPDVAEEFDVATISDLDGLAAEPDRFALCVPRSGGFRGDPQGLVALRRSVDFRLRPADLVDVRDADVFALTEVGAFCPVSVVSLAAPELDDAEVLVLEDDVGAFPVETPAATIRADVLRDVPELEDALDELADRVDAAALRHMNREVADGADPREVAREWLVAEELLAG